LRKGDEAYVDIAGEARFVVYGTLGMGADFETGRVVGWSVKSFSWG